MNDYIRKMQILCARKSVPKVARQNLDHRRTIQKNQSASSIEEVRFRFARRAETRQKLNGRVSCFLREAD
jgi:hypothetical protein